MSEFWQYIGVAVALIAAATYLTVHYIRRRKNDSGCSSCRLMHAARQKPTSSRTPSGRPSVN